MMTGFLEKYDRKNQRSLSHDFLSFLFQSLKIQCCVWSYNIMTVFRPL